eukprot:scaffold293_cov135-Cylindrotheca_fusiformis.AAC.5
MTHESATGRLCDWSGDLTQASEKRTNQFTELPTRKKRHIKVLKNERIEVPCNWEGSFDTLRLEWRFRRPNRVIVRCVTLFIFLRRLVCCGIRGISGCGLYN